MPWAVRLAPVAVLSFAFAQVWPLTTVWQLAAVSLVVCTAYVLVMGFGLRKTPLGAFVRPRMEAILGPRIAWLRTT
jgi:hypothetical protein